MTIFLPSPSLTSPVLDEIAKIADAHFSSAGTLVKEDKLRNIVWAEKFHIIIYKAGTLADSGCFQVPRYLT